MWAVVALAVIAAAAVFVAVAGFKPGYDPYGWLVWGRQTLHWNLNTDGAPSWKPLTFLFTLPYALFGHAAVTLWTVTSVAATLAGGVFAARIAFWLTGPTPARRWAPYVAGAFAGVGVLGMSTYAHLTLIANSDQLNVALGLAAIDMHLRRRPGLGVRRRGARRAGTAGDLAVRRAVRHLDLLEGSRALRFVAVIGLLLIPALWFSVPALTSKSWLRPGDLALNQHTIIHGNKVDRGDPAVGRPVRVADARRRGAGRGVGGRAAGRRDARAGRGGAAVGRDRDRVRLPRLVGGVAVSDRARVGDDRDRRRLRRPAAGRHRGAEPAAALGRARAGAASCWPR